MPQLYRYIILIPLFVFIQQWAAIAQGTDTLPVLSYTTQSSEALKAYYDPRPLCEKKAFNIPFHRAGNLILIAATADSVQGNFILDTGAPGLVLNITYFRNYVAFATSIRGGITGTFSTGGQTVVDKFSFGGAQFEEITADLAELGHIEDTRNEKIIGLLGVSLFKEFEMVIDYENNVIQLHHIPRKEAKTHKCELLSDTSKYYTFPIDIKENKIITRAQLSGKNLNFIIDTGAESNVLDSRLPNKIFDNVSVTKRVTLVGSGSQKVEALYGDLENLTIKNVSVHSMPVLITNLEKMCFSYDYCIDGMLGFDFLSKQKIGFNFVKGEMYVWK